MRQRDKGGYSGIGQPLDNYLTVTDQGGRVGIDSTAAEAVECARKILIPRCEARSKVTMTRMILILIGVLLFFPVWGAAEDLGNLSMNPYAPNSTTNPY